MSFFHTAGQLTGKAGAYLVEGTRLGASQFGEGAKLGYASKAAELQARRKAALAAPPAPAPRQRKLRTAA